MSNGEKAKGHLKEAAGDLLGNETLEKEGEAQREREEHREKAADARKRAQDHEEEARKAEIEQRARQSQN